MSTNPGCSARHSAFRSAANLGGDCRLTVARYCKLYHRVAFLPARQSADRAPATNKGISMQRDDGRRPDELREIKFHLNYQMHPEGSVLVEMGRTRVICAASVWRGVPRWMREQKVPGGWLTGEYSMLPSSTSSRKVREITNGKRDGRSQEIQRLIGRSLRAIVDLKKIGENTIYVDCDVIDADGGTRCASITGAAVALQLAFRKMFVDGRIKQFPIEHMVGAVSVGLIDGEARLDLSYTEDVAADVDMNVVMTEKGDFVEVQGAGEEATFERAQMERMLDLAATGVDELVRRQREALEAPA